MGLSYFENWPLRLGFCLSFMALSTSLLSQTIPGPNRAAHALPAAGKTAATKLTPNQQQGKRLLQTALAEAASLQPEMHTFVVWKIAEGYKKAEPGNAEALLRDAFIASLSIEDIAPETPGGVCQDMVGCGIKLWLQREILKSMTSSSEIEALLPQAQAQVQNTVLEFLIPRYLAKQNLEKARQLITSLAGQGQYPYGSALELIFAYPSGSPERVTIFSEAENAYRGESEHMSFGTGYDGLPGMVVRFWREVPPSMAEDAIDDILARAKKTDEGPVSPHLIFSGPAGSIALNSQYQYRLFELLPILEELAPSKAESLIRDNPDLRPMLKQFPEGLQAVQPDYRLHPPKSGEPAQISMSVSVDNKPATVNPLAVQAQQELQRRQKQIATDTETSPRQAIAEAMSLPEFMPSQGAFDGQDTYPRAQALLQIAQKAGKNPAVAKDALGELRKSLVQAPPMTQGDLLDDAASEYIEIGDQESAERAIKEGLHVAEKLYAVDNDSDDPNRAFKGAWPSTNQWQRCVQLGAKLSNAMVEAMIAGIHDPDIVTFQKVYFASSLLGGTSGPAGVAVITKDQERFTSF